jgi:hypothetical protein
MTGKAEITRQPRTADKVFAIHIAIHINVAYGVLPMTCSAVRALLCRCCHGRGRGFESRRPCHSFPKVRQVLSKTARARKGRVLRRFCVLFLSGDVAGVCVRRCPAWSDPPSSPGEKTGDNTVSVRGSTLQPAACARNSARLATNTCQHKASPLQSLDPTGECVPRGCFADRQTDLLYEN